MGDPGLGSFGGAPTAGGGGRFVPRTRPPSSLGVPPAGVGGAAAGTPQSRSRGGLRWGGSRGDKAHGGAGRTGHRGGRRLH